MDNPMGSQDNASSRKAATHWELEEEKELISFLVTRKSEAGDTMSFKGSVFTDAAIHINRLYPTQKCAPKSQSSCKTKWNNLKKTYNASDEHGVGVTPETSGTWDIHTKVHPQPKQFGNKGFPHFDAIEQLMLTAARAKFMTHQPHARKVMSASVAPSSSSSMPPPSSMPT
ncbi:hypothetical protein BDR07DRAFT_1488748 [Suillus spraguei]|nr:hypothetical protein BDR07DRAFT_1488748 [Suillus spraguei]